MRGMGHSDPIETVYVTHEEGNEREKNGVKRGFGGFYGAKLLKRQGEGGGIRLTLTPLTFCHPERSGMLRDRRSVHGVEGPPTLFRDASGSSPEQRGSFVRMPIRIPIGA